jgi:hypothetical protein
LTIDSCYFPISINNTHALSILSVATRDIEVGEEFLLDYGEAYTKAFLLPKPKSISSNIAADVLESELPGGLVEEDDRTELEERIDLKVKSSEAAAIDVEGNLKQLSL